MKNGKQIKIHVEISPDTSARFTAACLKILKRKKRQEAAGKATA